MKGSSYDRRGRILKDVSVFYTLEFWSHSCRMQIIRKLRSNNNDKNKSKNRSAFMV